MMIPHDNYDDKELLAFLGQQESTDILWGDNHSDLLQERMANGHILRGAKLPWANTHELIRFPGGKVTLWAGMNGHRKSMLASQVLMWFAQTERVGIASFEMPIVDTMERLVYQASGCVPSAHFAKLWSAWNHERICYYDQLDTVPSERVLGSIYYMANVMGCKHILIDSLTKCGLPSGDLGAEKRFMDTIAATAKALQIHIHIVCHVRKPSQGGEAYRPTKFDVRGAGELTDLVDNLFIVWKDKKREALKRKMVAGVKFTEDEKTYYDKNPDQRLICEKQRGGRWEGQIALWFDDRSLQFIPNDSGRPLPFDIGELRAVS